VRYPRGPVCRPLSLQLMAVWCIRKSPIG
jgi:hypothetical protein